MIKWKQEVKNYPVHVPDSSVAIQSKTYVRHFADICDGLLTVTVMEQDNGVCVPEIHGNGFGKRLNTAGSVEEAKFFIEAELRKWLVELLAD